MKKLIRITVLFAIFPQIADAATLHVDFDDLPPVQFSVTLEDGTRISETPDGTFQIVAPDGSETTVPPEFVPDGVLPAHGEIPIASPLPPSISQHVSFSTDNGAELYYFSGGAAVGSSVPNVITAAVDPNAFPFSANLYATFSTPVNGLTFSISSDNDDGEIADVIVVYDNSEQAVVPVFGNANPTDAIVMDLTEYRDVSSISIINIKDTFGLSYDDFTFHSASIPEPNSASCFLVATLMAIFFDRRRRH